VYLAQAVPHDVKKSVMPVSMAEPQRSNSEWPSFTSTSSSSSSQDGTAQEGAEAQAIPSTAAKL